MTFIEILLIIHINTDLVKISAYANNFELHNVFMVYTRAFNSVHGIKIVERLNQYNTPSKIISLIALTLKNNGTSHINKQLRSLILYQLPCSV